MSDKSDRDRLRQGLLAEINGYRASALLHTAVSLGIPDLLNSGSLSIAEMACNMSVHEPSLARLLRGLTVLEVVCVERDGRYRLTAKGELLGTGADRGMRSVAMLVGREYMPAWTALPAAVRSGHSGFEAVFGVPVWQRRQQDPQLNQAFNDWMQLLSADISAAVLAAYDFAKIERLVDVGGGAGLLMAAILSEYPTLQGVVFDRAHVIEHARAVLSSKGLLARCRFVAGDFFAGVPSDADGYVLLRVVHDWDDERARTILANCRKAMRPGGKVLVVERLLAAAANEDASVVMNDLHMLAITGGQERSEAEMRTLLSAAGLRVKRIVPTDSKYTIFESLPA